MKIEIFFRSVNKSIILALCIFHFAFLLFYFSPAISTPDAQGYFTQGKIIAKCGHSHLTPQNNLQYIGPHWHSTDGQKYFTTFPPGFPCLIAVIYRLFGANATFLINLILASVSLLIFFLLCKNWLSNNWSLAATLFLAINPFYNEHALFGDSHISVIFLYLLALLFLIKTIETDNHIYGILAGIAMGGVPTMRYAEFVLCLVFGCYVLWLFLMKKISAKTLVAIATGVLIPLFPLAIHNQIAFGRFWATGYGFGSAPVSFGLDYLCEHFIPYLVMLVTAGVGVLLPLSIIGFILLLKNSDTRSMAAYLLSSTITLTFLYMAYSWLPDPQSMRFLLPTFPIYTLAAVHFISRFSKNYRVVLLSIVILVSSPWGVLGSLRAVRPLHMKHSVLRNITNAVEKNIREGSIVITSEGICQNLDVYGKWKLVDISILSKADPTHDERPTKPIRNEYASRLYDSLSGCEFKHQLIEDLSQWLSGEIFLIAYRNDIEIVEYAIGDRFAIDKKAMIKIADVNLPARKEFDDNREQTAFEKQKTTMSPKPSHPVGSNYIFDFEIRKEPLVIVELSIK